MNKERRRRLRVLLFWRQQGRCFYCDQPMTLSFAQRDNIWDNSATLEHLHRRADGGDGTKSNLVPACRRCNERRGERDWQAYREQRSDSREV